MTRWRFVLTALLLAALIGGCGNSERSDETGGNPAPAASAEAPSEPLDGLSERLKVAGLAATEGVASDATDALTVGGVEIIYYADPREAAVTGAEIGKVMANRPRNGLAERYGQIVVWTANQNGLTAKERERFNAVTRVVAEGD